MDGNPTLFDLRDQAAWLDDLGWDEEVLRRVPVHERQDPNQDFLPLPDVTGPYGRALFVYRHEVSADVWDQLSALLSRLDQAGGHERRGMMTGSQERLTDWERPAG